MLAILSDIHGNYPALVAVLADLDRRGCRRVVSLGDIAGYYCMVNECIGALRELGGLHLKGNHDHYLATGAPCPRSRSASRCLAFQRTIVSEADLQWLAGLPERYQDASLSLVHGGWRDPIDEYLERPSPEYFEGLPGRFFFSGHTHVQTLAGWQKRTYCNPGSVGQPRDGDPRAAYAILDGGTVNLVRVQYDIDAVAHAMRRCGFERRYYRNLYLGEKIRAASG